jgi:DNA-binding NarL/FixJ family response regulator
MIRQTLEQHGGWEVSGEAADGRQAIDEAQRLKPDLVVLDLSMPVLNGLEAARVLKRLLPSVPLLMFTNFDSGQLKRETLETHPESSPREGCSNQSRGFPKKNWGRLREKVLTKPDIYAIA